MRVLVVIWSFVLILCIDPAVSDDARITKREAHVLSVCQQTVRDVAALQLNILIDDLDLAVGLKPEQRKKLSLAAKGTAIKYAKKQLTQDERIIKRASEAIPPGANHFVLNSELIDVSQFRDKTIENVGGDDKSEPNRDRLATTYPQITFRFKQSLCSWNIRSKNASSGTSVSGGFEKLLKTEPWNRTYGEIISQKNRDRYQEFKDVRANEAMTAMLMGYLELQLRLTKEQKPRVKKWLIARIKLNDDVHLADYGTMFKNTIKSLDGEGLDKILTENQNALWNGLRKSL